MMILFAGLLILILAWLVYGRPFKLSSRRWARTLNDLWAFRLPMHKRLWDSLQLGYKEIPVSNPGSLNPKKEGIEWWIRRLGADRFAVAEANEIERAYCDFLPCRYEMWLNYQFYVKNLSVEQIAEQYSLPRPVVALYMWRFGIVKPKWVLRLADFMKTIRAGIERIS